LSPLTGVARGIGSEMREGAGAKGETKPHDGAYPAPRRTELICESGGASITGAAFFSGFFSGFLSGFFSGLFSGFFSGLFSGLTSP
jgi:hypothetical protein